ncbi:MAG: ATP-dependent DNA helicase RecG [Azospirillum sp.]|nr:ATP-dependent DNA helicase RecG [Azospirillum sp.]MCZ8123996.1 ATP-dependent DNA helicase RecG [Magnetospirillum sp.]
MRPAILNPLFAEITTLPGMGPKIAALAARAAGPQVVDLLWHLPTGLVDRRFAPAIADAPEGAIVTLRVKVLEHVKPRIKRLPYKVRCADPSGEIDLIYFHAKADWLEKLLPPASERAISGRVERFRDGVQMPHPDHVVPLDQFETIATVEPTHRLTAGLSPKVLGKAIKAALARAPELPEWADRALVAQRGWPGWRAGLIAAHAPKENSETQPDALARQRLAYDELFANQVALALVRARDKRRPGRAIKGDGGLRDRVLAALPFKLTGSQTMALAEILGDMAAPGRMQRLLQGDVGSGKTVVAFLAMLNAIEAGHQAALMAPTEILARQHFETIRPLAEAAGIEVAVLTGRDKGKTKQATLDGLASGAIAAVVGTHALFEESVEFRELGLAVIDEQHRFGVHQRVAFAAKGASEDGGVDTLIMTATPIPRTLVMCAYGDMDVSKLTEKPPGRKPIKTVALPLDRMDELVERVRGLIDKGARVYWVCPLVEESELVDLAAATDRHADLAARLGADRVHLIHGKLKPAQKDAAMQAFVEGPPGVLVATTVIEVGVNVPSATVMVIEHAERFGLAQLHQLRGRVGRGADESSCVLLYAQPLGQVAKARLEILRDTEDGFRIAEEDVRLRGAGEVLGTRQSGLPAFRLADLAHHADLLEIARSDARKLLDDDATLDSPRGKAVRTLLYLFARDAAFRLARTG